ncbi:MAG: TolC family protein [bacterium]|nr:TolC family protein [bacterium]
MKEAYLKLARTQKEIRLTEDIYQEALNELEVVRKRFNLNLVHQIDVLKAEQAANEARYRLLETRNERKLANMKLAGMLFDQPGLSIEIADTFSYVSFSGTLEEPIQLAEERNLSLLKARLVTLQAEYNLALIKGETKPGLDLKVGGYLDHTKEETEKGWEIELRFDLFSPTTKISVLSERKRGEYYSLVTSHGIEASLFDNPSVWAEIKEAEAAIKENTARSKRIKGQITQQIRELYFKLKETENLLEVTEEGIQIAEEELRIIQLKHKMGQATAAELLKTKLALNRSQIRRNRLVYEYQLTLFELEELVGTEFPHISPQG